MLVVDFGAQYAQLIARRVREANVYSEIVPHTFTVEQMLAKDPAAIILGRSSSVYATGAPFVDPALFEAGVPVMGICYGFQAMAKALGGEVAQTGLREYGGTEVEVCAAGVLLDGTPQNQTTWMSHGDAVHRAPEGFEVLATSSGSPVAAFEDRERRLYGVQWHPEVKHSAHGQTVLEHFLYDGAGLAPDWTPGNVVADQVAAIRAQVGDARVICALSGGVDSAVAAALVQRAVGDQLTCVHVDHGLMRAGEVEQIERDFVAATGVNLVIRDEKERFLTALAGHSDPETKRKIIGREFIRVFEDAARQIVEDAGEHGAEVKFLVQGTLYPDVVESGGGEGAANIKSHHNVGGLPDDLQFSLVEPLRTLFRTRSARSAASSACRGDRRAAAVPGPRAGYPYRRRGHGGPPRDAARRRRDRARGAHEGRPRPGDLAVPGRAARRRPLGRRPGRRPHLRSPDRAAPRLVRGRDDGGLDAPAVRRAVRHLDAHHQRGLRGQPRRARRDEQAPGTIEWE